MSSQKGDLGEVAKVFFKLGCFAFGGPAAHVAMMEDEIVTKRKWITRQHFLDLMGATNLIPGPNSTEMTMHCGHERAGVPGLFVAGICFIFPAVVITGLFAWIYVQYGELPAVEPIIFGIKPAVLAIIASAIFKLGKKSLKSNELAILGSLVFIFSLFGVNEILALLAAGLFGTLYFSSKTRGLEAPKSIFPILFLQSSGAVVSKISAVGVFWSFLKVGAILYGSGYVLFAYLNAELVATNILSQQELIDAIAAGQFTPGPVLSTATFIGYQLAGWQGAIAASIGIFLPSFLFVWLLNPLVPKMRQSKPLGFFLDSVNVAAVAIMIKVLLDMSIKTLFDGDLTMTPINLFKDGDVFSGPILLNWKAWLIAFVSFFMVFGLKKVNAMWIVLGGAVLGFALSYV